VFDLIFPIRLIEFSPRTSLSIFFLFLASSEQKKEIEMIGMYAVHLSIEIDSENEIVAYVIKTGG
jgi:hypothetical protein